MEVYAYDPRTNRYNGTTVANESPLEPGLYHIPANATDVAPPAVPGGFCAVWNTEKNAWDITENHSGETSYATSNAGAHLIDVLGPLPDGYTTLVPPEYPVWDGSAWTQDVSAAQKAAILRIDAKAEALCTNLITTGLTQQTRYARKLAQAEALLQDGVPTEAEYPLIYNEVGITASNAGAVAKAIVAAAGSYELFCDTVEMTRMRAKAAIKAASTAALVASAEAAVVWPTGS